MRFASFKSGMRRSENCKTLLGYFRGVDFICFKRPRWHRVSFTHLFSFLDGSLLFREPTALWSSDPEHRSKFISVVTLFEFMKLDSDKSNTF